MSVEFSSHKKPITVYSLAGLADIVLLLLIFFLLTSNFIPQFGIQVNLPQATTAASLQDLYVTVAITDEGRYYVDQQPVSEDALLPTIRSTMRDRTAIVLRADASATVGQFAKVASIGKALQMRVIMATERERLR